MIAEILSVFQPAAYHQQGVFTDDGTTLRTTGTTEPLVAAGGIGMPGAAATASASPSAIPDADLAARFKDRPWYELPRLLAMGGWSRSATSCAPRTCTTPRSRRCAKERIPARSRSGASRAARTTDGTYNDLAIPEDGSGRLPLRPQRPAGAHVPGHGRTSSIPNPRMVSRELMTREQFQPATILNLLAASWIQFMVHDWFVHKRSKTELHRDPARRRATTGGAPTIRVPRSVPDAGAGRLDAAARLRQPEQPLVGRVAGLRLRCRDMAAKLRTGERRQAAHRADRAAAGRSRDRRATSAGFTDNWWIGLAMLHTLFTLEHNYICDLLAHAASATGTTSSCSARRKLINSALMAKIHTVEWTPAILPHPIIQTGDERELVRARRRGPPGRARSSSTTTSCSAASSARNADHHTAPYSLTEEFVSVYRMHPLIPDDYAFHSLVTGAAAREARSCPRLPGRQARRRSPSA